MKQNLTFVALILALLSIIWFATGCEKEEMGICGFGEENCQWIPGDRILPRSETEYHVDPQSGACIPSFVSLKSQVPLEDVTECIWVCVAQE